MHKLNKIIKQNKGLKIKKSRENFEGFIEKQD